MTFIRMTLVAAALGLTYAGSILAADTMFKDQHTIDKEGTPAKGGAGGPSGWERQPVAPGAVVGADNLTKEQYKNEKERIRADGQAARVKCKGMAGNTREACIAEARASEKAAKADLEARRKASAGGRLSVRVANSMEYELARKKCNEHAGKEKRACIKEARAQERAKNQAKAAR